MTKIRLAAIIGATAVTLLSAGAATALAASPSSNDNREHPSRHHAGVGIQVLSPRQGDDAGIAGKAWMVDLKLDYPSAASAGFTAPQLTGPGVHANAAPFPGAFSPGKDDRLPGLVVLSSTTTSAVAGFSGPGTNLANLFNVTTVTDRTKHGVQIQDTWIVGAPIAGVDVDTTLTVAVVNDLNHDGVYNDAPAVITDANHDGRIDARDLQALGVVGHVETVRFHLDGADA